MQVSDVVEPLLAETMQESYKGIELEIADEFGGKEGAEAGEGSIQAVPVEDHVHYYIVSESLLIGYNSIYMEPRKKGNNRGYYSRQLAALRNEEVVF